MRRILLALWLFSSLPLLAKAQTESKGARVFNEVGIDQKLDNQIPLDLMFTDERGGEVRLAEYFTDRPVIVALVYYNCPMLCTQILNGMVETFRTMTFSSGKEFTVVTVSIDPTETPSLAAEKKDIYLSAYGREGAREGWHFLTGKEEAIRSLANATGFRYVYDEASGQYAHASAIMVATPDGRLARYHYGIEYGARDLKFSIMEASEGRIGSPTDKLLLLCYHYDPMTGTYGVVVANLLRVGGALMLLILGGFVFLNLRRDRRKAVVAVRQ